MKKGNEGWPKKTENNIRGNVNGNGQECPLHTGRSEIERLHVNSHFSRKERARNGAPSVCSCHTNTHAHYCTT